MNQYGSTNTLMHQYGPRGTLSALVVLKNFHAQVWSPINL